MISGLSRSAAVLALVAVAAAARAEAPPTLAQAVGFYQAMDDARVTAAFEKILRGNPPGEVAAKAHLYLGLLAFNAFHPDQARAEMKKAIEANPAIDLPTNVSPKARLAFAEARRAVTRELETPEAAPARRADTEGLIDIEGGNSGAPAPAGSPPAPVASTTATAEPASRGIPAGTWWLGGFGLGALGAATVLGVVSNGVSSQDTWPKTSYHTISYAATQTAGYEALTADILFGVGGALLVGSIIWALVGSNPAAPSPSSPVAVAF